MDYMLFVIGVDHWGDDFGDCLGKHQSPINMSSEYVTPVVLPPLKFIGFDAASEATITNNGHTGNLNFVATLRIGLLTFMICLRSNVDTK